MHPGAYLAACAALGANENWVSWPSATPDRGKEGSTGAHPVNSDLLQLLHILSLFLFFPISVGLRQLEYRCFCCGVCHL